MNRKRVFQTVFLALTIAVISFAGPKSAMAVTYTVDDPSDGVQCSGATFTTISAAVLAASSNPLTPDIIVVCDGNYVEQVVIDKSLTLQAAQGQTPTIQFPLVATDPNWQSSESPA